jgi:hypothetical protein
MLEVDTRPPSIASLEKGQMEQWPVSSYFEMLRDEVPELFLVKLRQSQIFIYEESYGRAFLEGFDEPEARDLCGHLRRAISETQLVKIATECGLACEIHSNKKHSEHHRVIRIGRLFLTCSVVRTPQQKPRFARYRQQASVSPLFAFPTLDFLQPPEGSDKESRYVVIVHGPDACAFNRPGFLGIGVPDEKWKRWLEWTPVDALLEAQALRRIVTDQ